MLDQEELADGTVHSYLRDPPLAGYLFKSTGSASILWLVVRVWVGGQWLIEGWRGLGSTSYASPMLTVTAVGQTIVGLALVLGALVGIATTIGVLANMAGFVVPGVTQADPLQVAAAVLLILAWKNAGYLGLDRFILKQFGAPWWDNDMPHVSASYRRTSGQHQQ